MNVLDYIFVPKCLICNKLIDRTLYLCDDCMALWKNERLNATDNAIYLAGYNKSKNTAARTLVLKIKTNNDTRLYKFLVEELSFEIKKKLPLYEEYIVTNIPRTKEKVKENGLDQAHLLAKMTAKQLNIQYINILENKGTQVQKLLNYTERYSNADESYKINQKYINKLDNYKILLIDDVTTSGATLNKCGQILMDNGAANVEFASICRVNES